MDDHVLGGIEVTETSTLADARASIMEDEIPSVPENFLFLFGGAPVSRRQECRRRAVDCFPFLTIIRENARVAPGAAASSEGHRRVGSEDLDSEVADTLAPMGAPSDDTALATAVLSGLAEGEAEVSVDATRAPASHLEELDADGPVRGGAALELQIIDGPLEGTMVTVSEEGARIGRHTSNTLVIPEAGISRYHCEICYIDGEFCVRDLGSTTGTFFYLRPHGRFQMFTGLMVKLGETEFQVLSQTPPASDCSEQVVLFYEGPLAGHKVHVPASGITVGRRHNNHLVLGQDGTVSAHHAAIFCEAGEFILSDLGSCNGTCIRLSTERTDSDWHPIMDGDMLGAGCTKIQCRIHR